MRNGLQAGADGTCRHFNCAERSVDHAESIAGGMGECCPFGTLPAPEEFRQSVAPIRQSLGPAELQQFVADHS